MIQHLVKIHKELGGLNSQVIHIAGSKGKGTTATLLAKILEMDGNKVGLFSSPYLFEETEMININSVMIAKDRLEELKIEVRKHGDSLSEFEILTLAGLKYFNEEKCDYVVLECGWGGGKDATNVVENKILTILTTVELEHMDVLGKTVEEITKEKLGICRPGVPLLTSAGVNTYGIESKIAPTLEIGDHHPVSAGLAVAAAEYLGVVVNSQMYEELEDLVIPGRFEIIEYGQHTLILDGAHTFGSIQYLRERVLHYAQKQGLPLPTWAIHFLKDKPKDLMKLFPQQKTIWVQIDHPRASVAPSLFPIVTVDELFQQLEMEPHPKFIVIVGSFRLVSAAKKFILTQPNRELLP